MKYLKWAVLAMLIGWSASGVAWAQRGSHSGGHFSGGHVSGGHHFGGEFGRVAEVVSHFVGSSLPERADSRAPMNR